MRDWLRQRAQVTPHKMALMIDNQSWTFQALDQQTDALSAWLSGSGVQSGQLVAVLMPSSHAYVCLIHAVARVNATLIPLNERLTVAELTWQLVHTQAQWLIHDSSEKKRALALGNQTPHARLNIDAAPSKRSNYPLTVETTSLTDLQAIVFTSGTTGNPKGVRLTFANHLWSANASAYRLGLDPNDRWISSLPLYHVGGLAVIFRSCLYGTAVLLQPRFNLEAINKCLDTHQGSLISVVPTMLYRLLETRTHWPSTLRLILLGGAAAAPELVEKANALPRKTVSGHPLLATGAQINDARLADVDAPAPIVATTYGLTEAASQVATQSPTDTLTKPGSVGKPLMFTTVRIVAENGRSLPPNQIGEIVISGPTVMVGYHNDKGATEKALRKGALYSGDVGYLDDDGDLWLVQRRSDIIVSGGENVYPAEVEKVYQAHPDISAICVVGVPDEEWGEIVTAMVALHNNRSLDANDLLEYGRQQLADYKQPRFIQFAAALPLTASAKIHRQAVKEEMIKAVSTVRQPDDTTAAAGQS